MNSSEESKEPSLDWTDEKKLIACDLHDDVIQWLVGASMQLESIAFLDKELPKEANLRIEKGLISVKQAIERVYALIKNLAAFTIPKGKLLDELKASLDQIETHVDCKFVLYTEGDWDDIDPLLAGNIYHMVQEGCRNILKHAQADKALVVLAARPTAYQIVVVDNGIGVSKPSLAIDGFGQFGMKSRADILGGKLMIFSSAISSADFDQAMDRTRKIVPHTLLQENFHSGTCIEIELPGSQGDR